MKVLVDSSVWSLALRRREPEPTAMVRELRELIVEGRANLIGSVRQEILSGIRNSAAEAQSPEINSSIARPRPMIHSSSQEAPMSTPERPTW